MATPSERPVERRAGRPKGRDLVMRVLYEVEISGDDPLDVLELALGRFRFTEDGRAYAEQLVLQFSEHRGEIDSALERVLRNWDLRRVGSVERAILRLAVTELLYLHETPARVILDEALRLAHRYGSAGSPAFINGVCDPIARQARADELPGGSSQEP